MTRSAPMLLLLAFTAWADPADAPTADAPAPPADAPTADAPTPPADAPAPAHARVSPHHGGYDASDPRCAACHVVPPPADAAPHEARLRTEPARACATCHPADPHAGVREHVGKVVSEAARATLPDAVALDAGGEIRCWSCHEVHEGGEAGRLRATRLARAVAALQEGVVLPGAERERHAMLALPLEDGALCRACHGEGP